MPRTMMMKRAVVAGMDVRGRSRSHRRFGWADPRVVSMMSLRGPRRDRHTVSTLTLGIEYIIQ
jgi:hypothetical protein